MQSQDYNYSYSIHGHDNQILEITLNPNETIHAENGAMCFMEDSITMRTGTGPNRGPLSLFKRKTAGEGLLVSIFSNNTDHPAKVGFNPPEPAKVFPVTLSTDEPDIICRRTNFLAGHPDIHISLAVAPARTAAFAAADLFMQRLHGQGQVFLTANGALIERTLNPGETYLTEPTAITAFQDTVTWGVKTSKNLSNILFSKERMFILSLEGPGTIWFHSASNVERRLKDHFANQRQR